MLQTSDFDTLPVLTFVNSASESRHVWVCENMAVLREKEELLKTMPHITDIEVMDASVKFDR